MAMPKGANTFHVRIFCFFVVVVVDSNPFTDWHLPSPLSPSFAKTAPSFKLKKVIWHKFLLKGRHWNIYVYCWHVFLRKRQDNITFLRGHSIHCSNHTRSVYFYWMKRKFYWRVSMNVSDQEKLFLGLCPKQRTPHIYIYV